MARRSRLLTLIFSSSRLGASPSALAGQRIGEGERAARPCGDDDGAVGLADVEVALAERLERRRRPAGRRSRRARRSAASVVVEAAARARAPTSSAAGRPARAAPPRGAAPSSRGRPAAAAARRSCVTPSPCDGERCGQSGQRMTARAAPSGSGSDSAEPLPPHLPVSTLKLPHDSGARQSEISSFDSGRKSDHSSPTTRPGVSQTTSNWPSSWISPISTGLVMWWFGIMVE